MGKWGIIILTRICLNKVLAVRCLVSTAIAKTQYFIINKYLSIIIKIGVYNTSIRNDVLTTAIPAV